MSEQQPQIKTKETELSVILVSWQCDKCVSGEMKPTGFTQNTGSGLAHLHQCGICSHKAAALETYPKLAYKPVEPAAAPVTASHSAPRHTTRGKKR